MRRNDRIYRLLIVVVILCFSVGYAVLNSTLTINGTSNISKNTWDVHFESIYVVEGSVDAVLEPTISDDVNVDFEITLGKPGDFYEFYVDIVNRGTIDAMINSFQKTPDLTDEQKKYINYIIEYQNGELISSKQLVKANSFSKIKVRVEYKKDLIASELPTVSESLILGFNINYSQADKSGSEVTNNGLGNELITVKSGNGTKPGDEVCIKEECFYVISSDEEKVTLLTKYNLMVGNMTDETGDTFEIENPTGIQDPLALGIRYSDDDNSNEILPSYGKLRFSEENYWNDEGTKDIYPLDFELYIEDFGSPIFYYVYDENSLLYEPIENYKSYLETQGVIVRDARLMKLSELYNLSYVLEDNPSYFYFPEWITSTSFWIGSETINTGDIFDYMAWGVGINSDYGELSPAFYFADSFGVRPVIEISLSELYSNKK